MNYINNSINKYSKQIEMSDNNYAKKEDIINCLIERQQGKNIQESNKYISKIEVNNIYILKIIFIYIAKFYEYKSIRRIII